MANNTVKYLDLTGLGIYDAKIKAWVEAKKYQTEIEDLATIRTNAANAAGAWGVFLGGTDISKPSPKLSELATKNELSQAIIDLKNGASTGYDTLKGLETKIKEVATSVTDKNVTAEGESGDNALVNASATNNKVTVSTTQKLKEAVILAESALQKSDIAEGSVNGTISVDGSDVKVHGLGSAAYTDSSAYEVAGAAGIALGDAKDYTDGEIKKLNATTLKMSDTEDSSISDEITSLKNSVSGGTFFRGVVNSRNDIQDPKNGDVVAESSTGLEYIYDGAQEKWVELGDSSANAQAITNLTNNKLDKTGKAADSELLDGHDSEYFATKQSVTDLSGAVVKSVEGSSSTYVTVTAGAKGTDGKVTLTVTDTISDALNDKLGKDEKAADSELLDGHDSGYFATAQSVTDLENSLVAISESEINDLFPEDTQA